MALARYSVHDAAVLLDDMPSAAPITPKRTQVAVTRRALAMLAGSPDGCTPASLLAHGFPRELITKLVEAGLATTRGSTRLRITEAGRRALR